MFAPAGFCQQFQGDSCVAACCAMLMHRRDAALGPDIEATQRDIHAKFSAHHRPNLRDAAEMIGAICAPGADLDAHFEYLEAVVGQTWCVVEVMGGPWSSALRRHRRLREPFGALCTDPGKPALPRHAILVRDWEPNRIIVYDPWIAGNDQPVIVKPDWLRDAWLGYFIYLPLPST